MSATDPVVIGFSGTRAGMTPLQTAAVVDTLRQHRFAIVHHGDCVGADEELHEISKQLGFYVIVHPPKNSAFRAFCRGDEILPPDSYYNRNQAIVDVCAFLIAAPKTMSRVGGTWDTIRRAQRADKPVLLHKPDGKTIVP